MGLSLRMRLRGGTKKEIITPVMMSCSEEEEEVTIPSQFQCPISYDLMKDPVIIASGITYDRESIEKWFEAGYQTCPVTNTVLSNLEQIPNHTIRRMIQEWCGSSLGGGIERIPTPRVPVTSHQVSEICGKLSTATRLSDYGACKEMVTKMKTLGKESERNRKCVKENGVGLVLCVCFDAFSENANAVSLLEDIVSLLTWMLPIGSEAQAKLTTTSSFRRLVKLLRNGDQNAAFLVKELLELNEAHVHALTKINGVEKAFLKSILQESTCVNSLISIHNIISVKPETISRFLELDLVTLTVEMLVDSENSVCENALMVLNAICESNKGREEVRRNELVIPILVKKILKVSEKKNLVSVMWKICKSGDGSEVEEALRLGAFKKLVVMLQVGCGEGTKEKVTELLKMMNKVMKMNGFVERSDSSNEFKHVKKPF
ncbi:U-box domain-containing protein 20 [Cardamine amara subsp. amara]|uniref:U-box domain-containing protein n=1 Tax=Cardamine amara subsp. amara TaxID=228776 RepID=A0ABD1C160_CARAN